jgi:hypothetical protein
MLIFLVAVSAIAVMAFIEWQYSVMRQRVKVRRESREDSRSAPRERRY